MTNVDSNLNNYMHAWGARSVPFQDEEKQQLFETGHTRQAVERLQQSAALRSVMLLSGDNGVGKSALVAGWARTLEPKAYRPLIITQASLSASGVLCTLLAKLGQVPGYQRAANLSRMEDAITHLGSVIPVIILDEAQNYTASAMEEVRLLLGLNLPSQPVFCLIMIGDNYLLDSLRLQSRRSFCIRRTERKSPGHPQPPSLDSQRSREKSNDGLHQSHDGSSGEGIYCAFQGCGSD